MIHPSYVELMKVVNNNVEIGEEPVVNSRYSIVAATAKRARQIIDGKDPLVRVKPEEKPLSIAVRELYNGDLQILSEETAEEYNALETSYQEAQAAARAAAEKEELEAEAARKSMVEEDEADAEDEEDLENDAEAEEEQVEEE